MRVYRAAGPARWARGRPAAPVIAARLLDGAVCPGLPDPVGGRGMPPRAPFSPADALAAVMRPERLVVPDRVDFHVPGAVEHQVAAPGLRQRDPVQVPAAEHRVGRMRQPDPAPWPKAAITRPEQS